MTKTSAELRTTMLPESLSPLRGWSVPFGMSLLGRLCYRDWQNEKASHLVRERLEKEKLEREQRGLPRAVLVAESLDEEVEGAFSVRYAIPLVLRPANATVVVAESALPLFLYPSLEGESIDRQWAEPGFGRIPGQIEVDWDDLPSGESQDSWFQFFSKKLRVVQAPVNVDGEPPQTSPLGSKLPTTLFEELQPVLPIETVWIRDLGGKGEERRVLIWLLGGSMRACLTDRAYEPGADLRDLLASPFEQIDLAVQSIPEGRVAASKLGATIKRQFKKMGATGF